MTPPRFATSATVTHTASRAAVRRAGQRAHPAIAPASTRAQPPAMATSQTKYLIQPDASAFPIRRGPAVLPDRPPSVVASCWLSVI